MTVMDPAARVKTIIGDLVFQVASLEAELELARARIAEHEKPKGKAVGK